MHALSIRLLTFGIVFAISIFGQITQSNPGLCGDEGRSVPLPSNIWAVTGTSGVLSTVFLKTNNSDTPAQIPLKAANIEQVCPIGNDRLLVFGATIPGAYLVAIVSTQTGTLLDSFDSYEPVVSPDQHWLVSRDFYPPQSEIPFSEEYLLYDLTKDSAANHAPGSTVYTANMAGRVVYPVVNQGTPFEHSGLPQDQRHRFASDSFYWSPDSKTFLFGDTVNGRLSAILVAVSGAGIHTYDHPITATAACEQGKLGNVPASSLVISHAEVGPFKNTQTIDLQFRSSDYGMCRPKTLTLDIQDFRPAAMEVHEPLHRRDRSVLKVQ
jgi:hypothetical protein